LIVWIDSTPKYLLNVEWDIKPSSLKQWYFDNYNWN